MAFYFSNQFKNPIMFDIILKSYLLSDVTTQISLGYYNADAKRIIVKTCTVCILENAKCQWKI